MLQNPNGTFNCYASEGENDMRYLYCACAIASILDIWDCVDQSKVGIYVQDCITYEGGIALQPYSEAQGGAVYCAVASLSLMDKLDSTLNAEAKRRLMHWCQQR